MFNRVLVPLDGSMLAELALNPALQLARQARGAIVLMQVPVHAEHSAIESTDYDAGWANTATPTADQEADRYLRELQGALIQAGVQTRTMIVEGECATAIINSSCACNADLALMATHARIGVSRWLFGSVASKVLRGSSCHVLLVRRKTRFDHMLVILDGSPTAESVITPALSVAKSLGSRVTFLAVNRGRRTNRPNGQRIRSNLAEPQSYLAELQVVHHCTNVTIETAVIRDAKPEHILDYAASNRVDLIAISDVSCHRFSRFVNGRLVENLLGRTGCGILIARPPVESIM